MFSPTANFLSIVLLALCLLCAGEPLEIAELQGSDLLCLEHGQSKLPPHCDVVLMRGEGFRMNVAAPTRAIFPSAYTCEYVLDATVANTTLAEVIVEWRKSERGPRDHPLDVFAKSMILETPGRDAETVMWWMRHAQSQSPDVTEAMALASLSPHRVLATFSSWRWFDVTRIWNGIAVDYVLIDDSPDTSIPIEIRNGYQSDWQRKLGRRLRRCTLG